MCEKNGDRNKITDSEVSKIAEKANDLLIFQMCHTCLDICSESRWCLTTINHNERNDMYWGNSRGKISLNINKKNKIKG